MIRGIQEETGTTIEIEDDGTISIACVVGRGRRGGDASASRSSPPTSRSARSTRARCCACSTSAPSCSCCPGRDGLLHISQISHERVNAVSDHLKEGQIVKVKVLEADDKGRVRLSMKAVEGAGSREAAARRSRDSDPAKAGPSMRACAGYFATWRSRSSSSVLQSMHSVAVGRASRRFRPISTPQLSQ